jgi:hypothetical protein
LTISGLNGTTVDANIYDLDGKLVKKVIANRELKNTEEVIKISTGLIPGVYNLSLNVNNTDVINHKVIIIK